MLTLTPAQQDYHEDEIRAGGVGSLMVQDPTKTNELQRSPWRRAGWASPCFSGWT